MASFAATLFGGALASGVKSMFAPNSERDSAHTSAMASLDSFLHGMETNSRTPTAFAFSDLDAGDSLAEMLEKADSRSEGEKQLALFTGEADTKKKVKNLGKKITEGKEINIFDFI